MADKNKDSVKEMFDQALDKMEPQIKKAIDKVEPQIKKAKEKAKPYIDKVEPQIKKAKEKAEPAIKEAVGKAQRAATKTEIFLQYNDYEMRMDDIIDKVRTHYLSEEGRKASDLKSLRVYIKPEDHAAYYVANQHDTGKVEL